MHLVTGFAGYEHVSAVDMGAFNVAMLGSGQWVVNKGNKLAASNPSTNKITVKSGEIYMQGRYIRLDNSVDLTIENGKSGQKRNDLIVARYTKNAETGVEEVNLVVIKGTATAGDPVDPAYTTGDITAGKVNQNDMPLYRVPIDGTNVQKVVQLFEVKNWMIPQTAGDLSAIPIIDVAYASDECDMDVILTSGVHLGFYLTNGDTKNTPYAKGAVPNTYKRALILSYSGAAKNGFQIAIPNGLPYMLTRSYFSGTLTNEGNWIKVYSESYKPTAEAVGLGNVPNVTTNNQTPTFTQAEELTNLASGEALTVSMGKIAKAIATVISHLADAENPHCVTAEQAGAVPIERTVNGYALDEDIALSAIDVSALPIINGESGIDMNDVLKKGKHFEAYYTNTNTENTPYKAGLIGEYRRALILSYSGNDNNGFQIAIPNGLPYMLTRWLNGGTVGNWGAVYCKDNPPTYADTGAAPAYTYGTEDIEEGSASTAAEGTVHFIYE